MDEIYRGYRIAIKRHDSGWAVRITHPRGHALKTGPISEITETACAARARAVVDRYVDFLRDEEA